jgi:hypothetical protein
MGWEVLKRPSKTLLRASYGYEYIPRVPTSLSIETNNSIARRTGGFGLFHTEDESQR